MSTTIKEAKDEWNSLLEIYGDYAAPFEVVHTWIKKWQNRLTADIILTILSDTIKD